MCSPQIHPQFVVLNQNLEYTSSSLRESLSVIEDLHDDATSFWRNGARKSDYSDVSQPLVLLRTC